MIGTLAPTEIERLLHQHRIGRLAVSAEDHPFIVPIAYAYDGECLYGYSMNGRKIQTMRAQPRVCFEIDEIDSPSSWRSVVAEGVYEELATDAERRAAIRRLAGIDADLVPVGLNGHGPHHIVLFRIRLATKSGRFERRDA